ncbi:MAG: phosphatase PAP2 family protein [Chitinophagaceae bacterium]|nr:phosphatase PAP2 family protein [Chitinophagaceae bacterium]
MKKYIFISLILLTACNKDIVEVNQTFPMLSATYSDSAAGKWKTILGFQPDTYPTNAPLPSNDAGFLQQLNDIAALQKNATPEDMANLRYWGTGGVLRWNEILRELVAKYNLPPVENADGTYPIPSANNPLAYPFFPFANPPYAARAYAYVSAAQYDALVTAFFWKSRWKRLPAYQLDNRIQPMLADNGGNCYPSADAVIYGVTGTMLRLLFPGEVTYINQQLAKHRKARLLAGMETASDLEAGEALGNTIAQLYIQRARTDGAGAAVAIVNGVNLWKVFEDDCIARNEIPWMSMESPKRPPMLPFFGKVKPFLFDSATMVTTLRPLPPPSTRSIAFQKELEEVRYYSQNQTRERLRIVHFWADGVGTYTPPGHWNAIAAEEFVKLKWSEVRWARAFALLNMSLMDAAIVCWDAKYTYYNPRPSQVDNSIKTLTGLPNFPAYTSGHSTFSGAAAEILGYLVPSRKQAFSEMAAEASMSRLYGAIHYRSDCTAGLASGKKVGEFAVKRAIADGAGN